MTLNAAMIPQNIYKPSQVLISVFRFHIDSDFVRVHIENIMSIKRRRLKEGSPDIRSPESPQTVES
jgi:hypothetical protein